MKYSIFRGSDRKKMALISAGAIMGILILGAAGVIVLKPKAELLFGEIAEHISFDDLWYKGRRVLRMAGQIVFFAVAVILIRKLKKKHEK